MRFTAPPRSSLVVATTTDGLVYHAPVAPSTGGEPYQCGVAPSRPIGALLVAAVLLLSACAAPRADSYNGPLCYELKRDARTAGAYSRGASAVATGLAAGGAVVPIVSDSKGAQVGLALGAVFAGAVALGAGFYSEDAHQEWADHCPAALAPVLLAR